MCMCARNMTQHCFFVLVLGCMTYHADYASYAADYIQLPPFTSAAFPPPAFVFDSLTISITVNFRHDLPQLHHFLQQVVYVTDHVVVHVKPVPRSGITLNLIHS